MFNIYDFIKEDNKYIFTVLELQNKQYVVSYIYIENTHNPELEKKFFNLKSRLRSNQNLQLTFKNPIELNHKIFLAKDFTII
jgi:hypothetical protein